MSNAASKMRVAGVDLMPARWPWDIAITGLPLSARIEVDRLFHYTNNKGYKAISSQVVWVFKASQPPGDHPKAAYFTTLPPGTKNLGKRLFVRGCSDKTQFFFKISGADGLPRLRGGRGDHIHYSEEDYPVQEVDQKLSGETQKFEEERG